MQVSGRGFVENIASCVSKFVAVTSDNSGSYSYSLEPYEQIVEVDSTLGVATITLPHVAEAAGRLYSITAITGGTNAVTVAPYATNESYD